MGQLGRYRSSEGLDPFPVISRSRVAHTHRRYQEPRKGLIPDEGVRLGAAIPGQGRGPPRMEVLTLSIWKTSTCPSGELRSDANSSTDTDPAIGFIQSQATMFASVFASQRSASALRSNVCGAV